MDYLVEEVLYYLEKEQDYNIGTDLHHIDMINNLKAIKNTLSKIEDYIDMKKISTYNEDVKHVLSEIKDLMDVDVER